MTPEQRDQLGERLCAYLDGEAPADECAEIESLLENDAEACAMLAELRIALGAVRDLPRSAAPEDVLEGITSHIERAALLGDAEREVTLNRHKNRPVRSGLAMAAMVAIAIGGGFYVSARLAHTDTSPSRQVVDAEATPSPRTLSPHTLSPHTLSSHTPSLHMEHERPFRFDLDPVGKKKAKRRGETVDVTSDAGADAGDKASVGGPDAGAGAEAGTVAGLTSPAIGLLSEKNRGDNALPPRKEKSVLADRGRERKSRDVPHVRDAPEGATPPQGLDVSDDRDSPLDDLVAELGTRITAGSDMGAVWHDDDGGDDGDGGSDGDSDTFATSPGSVEGSDSTPIPTPTPDSALVPTPVSTPAPTPTPAPIPTSVLLAVRADLPLDAMKGAPGTPEAPKTAQPEPPSLADRTFEQRLAMGEGLAVAREHAFANEPLQLKLAFADPEAQVIFEQQMRRYFLSNHVRPLDEANRLAVRGDRVERTSETDLKLDAFASDSASNSPSPLSLSPARAQVFMRGAPERNYLATQSGERQYLLRIPASLIGGLIDLAEAFHPLQVELNLGQIKAGGANKAKQFVQGLSVIAEKEAPKPLDVAAPFDMLALLERVGLSPVMGIGNATERKAGAAGAGDSPPLNSLSSDSPSSNSPSNLPSPNPPPSKIAPPRAVEATSNLVTLVVDLSTREPSDPPVSQLDGDDLDTNE